MVFELLFRRKIAMDVSIAGGLLLQRRRRLHEGPDTERGAFAHPRCGSGAMQGGTRAPGPMDWAMVAS